VDGNQFRVELQVGELGKYIREANTNFPWRNYNVFVTLCLRCKTRDQQ
jgi:hypothetical protein